MPNFNDLTNRFKLISEHLNNQLETNLPNFDEAEFFQVFGKKLQDNLSAQGNEIYGRALNQNVLTMLHKEAREKLNQDYKNILASAVTMVQENFDPKATVNYAQEQLELKLNQTKQSLINNLNNELARQNQEFGNPADKKELATAFNNYLDTIGQKYKNNLNEINSIISKLAKSILHQSNEEKMLKVKYPDATFSINETDLDKLSIGEAPNEKKGWTLDIDNLVERLMHRLANQKPGEKLHIALNIPDRAGIIRQIGDIGFQGRSPAVALFALLVFYILAVIRNNDVERMITAFEKIIKEKGIAIDPNDISYTIKQINSNGKNIAIKEKGPLSSEHVIRLQQANQELKGNLKKEQAIDKKTKSLEPTCQRDAGYDSDSELEEQTQEENFSSRPRL